MLTFKDKYLRPFRTMKLLVALCKSRGQIIEQQKTLLELQRDMNTAQNNCIAMQREVIQKLAAEVTLLKATTVSSVDTVNRDGVLDPAEPKK